MKLNLFKRSGAGLAALAGIAMTCVGCATSSQPRTDFSAPPPAGEPTGFLNKTFGRGGGEFARYVVYVPYDYTPDQAWPMIVFLHGAGERGNDGLIQTEVGIGTALRRTPGRFPAIVVFPQCPEDQFWDSILDVLEGVMAKTREQYHIDPARQYLTGLSMGGYGAWLWGATKADTFAALMPVCGGGAYFVPKAHLGAKDEAVFGTMPERVEKLATVPIWAFHGADDDVVPPAETRMMVERVRQAGGEVKLTIFPKTGHNSWDQAYGHKKAIRWLFKQSKD